MELTYVLWVLGFTFPTLFQGWQTLVGFLMLRFMSSLGHIELTNGINRSGLLQWLPAMVLHVLVIYSGSRALARLPVPVFLCLQGQVEVMGAISEAIISRHFPKPRVVCSWFIMTVSCMTIWLTDPQYDHSGYKWMGFHLVVASQSAIYVRWHNKFLLSDVDRLQYVYAFSVFLFVPGSVLLGDVSSSSNFPHWYVHHFYIGCIMSGILGVSLALCHLYMKHSFSEFVNSLTNSAAKILCVGVSAMIFFTVFNTNFFLSVFFSLAGQLIHSISKCDWTNYSLANDVTDEFTGNKLTREQA